MLCTKPQAAQAQRGDVGHHAHLTPRHGLPSDHSRCPTLYTVGTSSACSRVNTRSLAREEGFMPVAVAPLRRAMHSAARRQKHYA
eukprot:scaffold131865_cov87-Phaeocystis_antarctica.AAC.1